jgi:putative transposase
MARLSRVVLPGCWHHATQRGNRRQTVFFEDSDRLFYIDRLREYCSRDRVKIVGHCLMTNHVHLVLVPESDTGLARALGRTHNDYARWLNFKRRATGHVWQNRFFSCPLDEAHQWHALRYVERNPVRAGMVEDAADWPWSSAVAHISGIDPHRLIDSTDWRDCWTFDAWREELNRLDDDAPHIDSLRRATRTGRPAGSADFVHRAEAALGRTLHLAKRGPRISGTGFETPETPPLSFGIS